MTTLDQNDRQPMPRPPDPPEPYDRRDPPRPAGSRWTTGRIFALVAGLMGLVSAVGMLVAGGAVLAVDSSWREDGYLTSDEIPLTTTGHAVAADRIDLEDIEPWWPDLDGLLGKVRIRATSTQQSSPVFIGVAPADRAADYLSGVDHSTLTEIADPATEYVHHPGGAPVMDPAESDIWTSQASGTGTQSLNWPLSDGIWTVVVMNADGSSGVDVSTDIGAEVPINRPVAIGLLVTGAVLGAVAIALVMIAVRRARRQPTLSPHH